MTGPFEVEKINTKITKKKGKRKNGEMEQRHYGTQKKEVEK